MAHESIHEYFLAARLLCGKLIRAAKHKVFSLWGRFYKLERTLSLVALKPFSLAFELTNICNANCVFCPYQFQKRPPTFMSDQVFEKALNDFITLGGGSISFTPVVGEPLLDKKILSRIRNARSYEKIDRIWMITNAIRVDAFGAAHLINAGLNTIGISVAGFDEKDYASIYRSSQYLRVRKNILALLEASTRSEYRTRIVVLLRGDKSLRDVVRRPDFKTVMRYKPKIDFAWSYQNASGRITAENLKGKMKMKRPLHKREACFYTYVGPTVLEDGTVLACRCISAMDAISDLAIGNVLQEPLGEIWSSDRIWRLRRSFGTSALNATCSKCSSYKNLDFFRTKEGRAWAEINRKRAAGMIVKRNTVDALTELYFGS